MGTPGQKLSKLGRGFYKVPINSLKSLFKYISQGPYVTKFINVELDKNIT